MRDKNWKSNVSGHNLGVISNNCKPSPKIIRMLFNLQNMQVGYDRLSFTHYLEDN